MCRLQNHFQHQLDLCHNPNAPGVYVDWLGPVPWAGPCVLDGGSGEFAERGGAAGRGRKGTDARVKTRGGPDG